MFDYTEDYKWIRDSIMVALGVNQNLIMGEGPSMSNVKDLGLMKLYKMWKGDQDIWTDWMKYNFYEPLAEANKFRDNNNKFVIPEIEWSTNFETDRDETEDFKDLWTDGIISTKTRMSKYKNVNFDMEQENLKKEIGSIFDDGQRIKNREYKNKNDENNAPEEIKKEGGEISVEEAGKSEEKLPIEKTQETEGPKPEEVKETGTE